MYMQSLETLMDRNMWSDAHFNVFAHAYWSVQACCTHAALLSTSTRQSTELC